MDKLTGLLWLGGMIGVLYFSAKWALKEGLKNTEKYKENYRLERQYKDSALFTSGAWVGIILLCLIMLLFSGYLKTETIENVNDDEINLSYPDENVMWIGDNGDTIWE